jgi:cell division protease FtsH
LGNARNIAFWVVLFLLILALFNLFSGGQSTMSSRSISYSDFVTAVDRGEVSSVTLDGERVMFRGSDGQDYVTIRPEGADITDRLIERNVTVNARPQEQSGFTTVLMTFLPFLLLIGVWIYFMNRMQGGGRGGAMGFGKIRAKLLTEKHGRVTFDDVAGIDEAKEELEEIVEFLRNPQKFSRLGGKIPKGALLVGPPGTGKTLLARAIAGEAGVPFFTISGSDFVEMFVGVGASRVRDMFEQAKKNAPCIVFIDEIDAVGRSRGVGYGGGNDEREQTLNQLLVEMDGFEANEGIIIVAATNRPDVLDPALLRPGRFDRQVQVPNPDIKGREKILGVHARKVPLGPDVDLRIIARGPGFLGSGSRQPRERGGADGRPRGPALRHHGRFRERQGQGDDGAERRSMVMSEDEKKLTAYHEAGHAIVGLNVPAARPDPQGHDHPARPRAGACAVAARTGPAERELHQIHVEDRHGDGRQGGRGADLREGQRDVGRGVGHSAGVADRPRDGDAVRLLRPARPYRLRQRAAELSRHLQYAGERQSRHSAEDRCRSAPDR